MQSNPTSRKKTRRSHVRRALRLESLETRQLMAGDIAGTVFDDLNQNGVRDGGESGVQAGWRVFVDTNLDGKFTAGEASALTNKDGDYLIKGVPAGLQRLAVEIPAGWTPTKPASQDITVINSKEVKADFFAFGGGNIAGTVWNDLGNDGTRDASDPVLSGWTIYLDLNKNLALDAGEPQTLSNADGHYEFNNVPAGDYEVSEVLPVGWEPTKRFDTHQTATVVALGTAVQDFGNFSTINGSVKGTVWNDLNGDGDRAVDASTGLPTEPGLEGWTVFVDANVNGLLDTDELSTTSDSQGDYQFPSIAEGTYDIVEVMPSGSWSVSPGYSNPQTVTVFANETTNGIDFANFTVLNGGILGTIWNDLNRDGIRNTALSGEFIEPGLASWTVALDLNRNGSFDLGEPSAITDAAGQYSFNDLQVGEYDLLEIVPSGWETAPGFGDNQSIRVYSGAISTPGDFANFNLSTLVAGSIAGTVWEDVNANGAQDASEAGVAGWTVYADLDSSGTYSTGEPQATTASDGSYVISGVTPGTTTVRVAVSSGWHATSPATAARTLTLKNGENIVGVNFGAKQTYESAITGTVFSDKNHNGLRDAGENGISGITFFLDLNGNAALDAGEPSQSSSIDQFFTPGVDETGTFNFTHLANGTYQVRQILPATLSATPASELLKTVTVASAASSPIVNFADVYRANEIHGSLFDDANANSTRDPGEGPLSGKSVYVDLNRNNSRDADEPQTTTDVDGKYSFTNLTPGVYVVRQELEAGSSATFPTTLGGTLWPTGTSNPSIGNVSPGSITLTLARDQTARQLVSLTLPGSGGISNMVDVFLLFDDTGSFVNNSPIVRGAFPTIISQLQGSLPGVDLGFGVGRFEEYANYAWEYSTGRPFVLNQPIVSSSTAGYMAAVQSALDRTTPGYGGDQPETDIEALYQLVTGVGFDGNNDGTTNQSGAAGLASTQLNPGDSGDVPAFSTFKADSAHGVLAPDGAIGGGGFRAGSLPVILLATDTGFAYQPKGETTISGVGGVSLPISSFTETSRPDSPFSHGAGIQETITALNALGALVIGLGTNTEYNLDPRQGLESISKLTGAINQSTSTIDNGTADPIAPGDPMYFQIASGVCWRRGQWRCQCDSKCSDQRSYEHHGRASDPRVHIINHSGTQVGVKAGQTASFDIEFVGDGAPHRFDLQFVREGTDVVLGSIPVVIGTPIPGDGYHFDDLVDGEIELEDNFGRSASSSTTTANVAPSFVAGPSLTVLEDAGAQSISNWATNISAGPTSENWQAVDFQVAVDHPELFSVLPTVTADGTLSFTSATNAFGSAVVSVVIHDNGGSANGGVDTSAAQSITINVTAVNDAPNANDDSYSLNEDQALSVVAPGVLSNDSDIEGDSLSAKIVANPAHGSLSLSPNGSLVYTPNTNFFGIDSFVYMANDGSLDSNTATVVLNVASVNDAPTAIGDSYDLTEDQTLTIAAPGVLSNDIDADSDALTAKLVAGPQHGVLTLATNGSIVYTPNANYAGTDSFVYVANDGTVDSNLATVALSIAAVNDAPTAVDDSYSLNEDTVLTIAAPGILANDSDIDSTSITAALVTGPTNGKLVLNPDGSFSYTPNLNFNGTDSFKYLANDGSANSSVAVVTIQVKPVNDAPTAGNDGYSTKAGTALPIAAPGVLANDSDVDGDAIQAVLATGPSNGTLTLNANGSFNYVPNSGFSGTDSFTYQAKDAVSSSANATVTIIVSPVATNAVDYVVVDQSRRRVYEYGATGSLVSDTRLAKENQTPLGLAANQDGTVRWSLDKKGDVFVYDAAGTLLGTWTMNGLNDPQGITVSGNDLWVVDQSGSGKVLYYAGAASRRSGIQAATSSFALDKNNQTAMDLVTNGSNI
ncbi:MAG: tandem-95 repeat protein [Pirellulales bacterium]